MNTIDDVKNKSFNKYELFGTCVDQTKEKVLNQKIQKLYDLLSVIYFSDKDDLDNYFNKLLKLISFYKNNRIDELKELDEYREINHNWFLSSNQVAYCTYIDKFSENFNTILSKLPYLNELGITYLHLLPFFKARPKENDGGFAVENFKEIEPKFGNIDELTKFTKELRRYNISLCSDFVLNHISDTHEWALKAKNNIKKYQDYFYFLDTKEEVNEWEKKLNQVFPQTSPGNFTYISQLDKWVWTTFYPYQWDLNYTNKDVFYEIVDSILFQANCGVEIFRLDSTGYLWKKKGSSCMNLPEVHLILQALRVIIDIVCPGVVLKAEAIVPTRDLPPYFGDHSKDINECHLAYHSSLMAGLWFSLAQENIHILNKIIQDTPILSGSRTWITYVRCHDDIGWNVLKNDLSGNYDQLINVSNFYSGKFNGSYSSGQAFQTSDEKSAHGTNGMTSALVGVQTAISDDEYNLSVKRFFLLYSVIFSFPSIPLVYMGDEFALGNNLNDKTLWPTGADGRELHRPKMPQELFDKSSQLDNRTFTFNNYFKKIILIKKNNSDFSASTSFKLIDGLPSNILGYIRNNQTICLFNFSKKTEFIDLSLHLNGKILSNLINDDFLNPLIKLNAYDFLWLKLV